MTYIVKPNDTINSIAEKFKISVNDLIKENNLEYIYMLVPGLELIIPQNDNSDVENENIDDPIGDVTEEDSNSSNINNIFSYYIVEKGDNLYQIGKRYNISPQVLAEINGLDINDIIYPNQQILVPQDGVGMYITKKGDTMRSITNDLNAIVEDILINNENIYLEPDQIIMYKVTTKNPTNF